MKSPYTVAVSALEPRRNKTLEEGPEEPTGAIPEPVTAAAQHGEGPFDRSLAANALGL